MKVILTFLLSLVLCLPVCIFANISICEAVVIKAPVRVKPPKSKVRAPHVSSALTAIRKIETINQHLVGKCHPISGVPFRAVTTVIRGVPTSVVVPKFDSVFTTSLPKHLLGASREAHFAKCTADLAKAIDRDKTLASKFTERQLAQIRSGSPKIDGLTWHHSEREGIMELVDEIKHSQTAHTGGYSLWGAGAE